MMWPELQTVAPIVIGHILNSLPEGLLIALVTWLMLRILPRQNSGTRFAVWFVALLAVSGLPFIDAHAGPALLGLRMVRPLFTLSGPWGLFLFLAWVVAAGVTMLRLAAGLWRLRELRRSCLEIKVDELDPAVGRTIAGFSSTRSVTLATSERLSVPAAIGFFKPIIVIPSWALRELVPEELNVILLHEFAHLRRWDDWTNLLQKLVRTVFLFHPAVWWIERRLSLEREMACDDLVVAETANPRGYARCLVALLEKTLARRSWGMAQAIVHRARDASLRLAQILDVSRPQTSRVWKPALSLVGALCFACLLAVPHAPQLVAFERSTHTVAAGAARSAALLPARSASAAVIPAAMHTRQSSAIENTPQPHVTQVVDRRSTATDVVMTRRSAEKERSRIAVVTVGMKRTLVPAAETLLVIRTTQRVGPNSWLWSVSVWRITSVVPDQEGLERITVASRT